jgi:energy-coupling factor transporter ATP-binding protein EcfA2
MKISVTNLGAIKEATVEIGGLTVFVGQNGTGKSYLAKVIYGLQKGEAFFYIFSSHEELFQRTLFGKNFDSVEELRQHLYTLTPDLVRQIMPIFANFHAELLKNKLGEYFNDDSGLFANTTISYSELEPFSEEKTQHIISTIINHSLEPESDVESTVAYFSGYLSSILVNCSNAEYFPAARSNFMLTYKALYRARADEYVGLTSSKAIRTRRTGALTRFDAPTEDFLSRLYDLDSSQESPLAPIADKLQTLLYGKDQLLMNQAEGTLADFRYHVKNSENKLRLHLTSSMVTETSPLLIGLKYWIDPDSLVIIDEPESHLHPEAQRALVNGLAEAVNQGLKVILITHSPYILSCVNNLIKFNRLVENFPADKDVETLKNAHPEMVALNKKVTAYHFGSDGIVKDIVLASGLIDEAEFTEPFDRINEIYEAMRDIEWEHRA